jgi:NAD(P)H-dependent FMN reductase
MMGALILGQAQATSKTPRYLVISCSLSQTSNSALLAEQAVKNLKAQGHDVDFIDLRKFELPLCNGHGGSAYDHPQVKEIHDRINKADGILIAAPIFNNAVGASAKNLIELTTHAHKDVLSGKAWDNKVVGFMGAAGSKPGTYAFLPFMNGLIIDAEIIFVPTFVTATREDIDSNKQIKDGVAKRIDGVCAGLTSITAALKR